MNLVTRLPFITKTSLIKVAAEGLEPLLTYDPQSLVFWGFTEEKVQPKWGGKSLKPMDAVNAPFSFSDGKGMAFNAFFQQAYAINNSDGKYLTDSDLPNGVTMIGVFYYTPATFTGDANRILFGNLNSASVGMAITTLSDVPGYSVGEEHAEWTLRQDPLVEGWCFAALSYNKKTREINALWVQDKSSLKSASNYVGTDDTPYTDTTLGYTIGNGSWGPGVTAAHKVNNYMAEFSIFDQGMSAVELNAKYREAQTRMNALGISI